MLHILSLSLSHYTWIWICFYLIQLAAFYNEQMDEMSSWMSMHRYYRRMMECIADQMEHQVRVSWYAYQPSADEQLTVVLNAAHVNDDNRERDSVVGMLSRNAIWCVPFCSAELPRGRGGFCGHLVKLWETVYSVVVFYAWYVLSVKELTSFFLATIAKG